MKRKLLFSTKAKRWNSLLRKFNNLYQRINTGKLTHQQLQHLINKLQSIYQRLEKMQYAAGIKIAGTAVALTMLSATGFSQDFTSIGYLTGNNIENFCSSEYQTFADVDIDGDLDLYVGEGVYYGSIKVFTNDGSGNFTANGNLQADGSDIILDDPAPEFADVDGDNDLDLYVGDGQGKINIFINDGFGNFSAMGYLQADGTDIDIWGQCIPELADIDDDGDLDLCTGNGEGGWLGDPNYINVFTNDGSGNFAAPVILQADGNDCYVGMNAIPKFADIDNDNDLDLYVGRGQIKVFTNDSNGNFSASGNLQADGADIESGWSSPVFADIDDDNDLDLYIGDLKIEVFTNDGSGNFTSASNLRVDDSDIIVGGCAAPVFADIDGDSDLELYIGNGYGKINVFINDVNGNFTDSGYMQADGSDIDLGEGSRPVPVLADIDDDDDFDLYVGDYYGKINIFINDGSGNFSAAGNLQADGYDINVEQDASPVFADIDGDSNLDLYIGNKEGLIKVFTNDGSGGFSAAGNLQSAGYDVTVEENAAPEFADIDGDSDLDLYVGNYYGYISVFTNNGNGSFTSSGNLQADGSEINVEYRTRPTFEDIDSDSDLDLYVGDGFGRISVFINNESHEGFDLDVTAFLQGPFDSSEMLPSLNTSGVIPLTQPYEAVPWEYNGDEEVTSIPNINVVDWVLVELRQSGGDVTTATESTVIAESAGFILQDGSIVGLDGSSKLSYDITITQNLYVVIKHRNHLGIISTYPLINSIDTYSYDFTTAAINAYGGELSQIEVVPGVWSMIAGNGDGNDQIDNKDKNEVWLLENNTTGYFSGDYDMDSDINSTDNSIMWKPNSGSGGQIP